MVTALWVSDERMKEAEALIRSVCAREFLYAEREAGGGNGLKWLLVYDGDETVAAGLLRAGKDAFVGPVATVPHKRRQGFGSLAARMLIRRAYDMGYNVQYGYCAPELFDFCGRLGFVSASENIPLTLMRREGDVGGSCR